MGSEGELERSRGAAGQGDGKARLAWAAQRVATGFLSRRS